PLFHTSSSVFTIISTPPRSTLFPYTTLFRSRKPLRATRIPRRLRKTKGGRNCRLEILTEAVKNVTSLFHRVTMKQACHIFDGFRDRKSTRLNSSHLVISYAVFCLNKKIIIII